MSKTKKTIFIVAILSTIILAFIGGNAYSKYVTEVRGNGVAQVATWSFKVNGAEEQIQTINLASTCSEETVLDNKIAPGTSGSFQIKVDGSDADVGIDYEIKFENDADKPSNLKFKYQDVEYYNIHQLEKVLAGRINANDEDKTRTIVIDWEWPYETGDTEEEIFHNDRRDTDEARVISQFEFDVVVSGTQVQPQ